MWSHDYLVISRLKGEPRSVGDFVWYSVFETFTLILWNVFFQLSGQFPLLLLLIQFLVQKQGAGCENLTSMQIWLWNDPILTFEDRYLIVFTILYIQYDCMSNNYLW